jgi:hypothetical protein
MYAKTAPSPHFAQSKALQAICHGIGIHGSSVAELLRKQYFGYFQA